MNIISITIERPADGARVEFSDSQLTPEQNAEITRKANVYFATNGDYDKIVFPVLVPNLSAYSPNDDLPKEGTIQ